MQIEEREIEADQVKIGMFVCRLDRPWTDTPFPLQGFMVRDIEQIAQLRDLCGRVWIDVELSKHVPGLMRRKAPSYAESGSAASLQDPRIGSTHYEDSVALEAELPAAREALEVGLRAGRGSRRSSRRAGSTRCSGRRRW